RGRDRAADLALGAAGQGTARRLTRDPRQFRAKASAEAGRLLRDTADLISRRFRRRTEAVRRSRRTSTDRAARGGAAAAGAVESGRPIRRNRSGRWDHLDRWVHWRLGPAAAAAVDVPVRR